MAKSNTPMPWNESALYSAHAFPSGSGTTVWSNLVLLPLNTFTLSK